MGKKGNWLSALKRVFNPSSKDKPINGLERNYLKEKKKWGFGKLKHGETNTFSPLYREPSSIEKILGDAEREQRHKVHQVPPKKVHQPKAPAPRSTITQTSKSSVTPNYPQISAIKIQAAYRGYVARKSYRALKGLVRLQGVMRGQSVKRQTMNAMKCMQLLVRVQSQIRSRRLQMMESRNINQHQTPRRSDKEQENGLGKWAHQWDDEANDVWDDSVLTKEEVDARMQRKVEAVMKRERALAYAYSQELLKVTPKSAHAALTDIRSGGFPWWWNWLERQLPHENQTAARPKPGPPTTPKLRVDTRPNSRSSKQTRFGHENPETPTLRSSKPFPTREKHPFNSSNRWQQSQPKHVDKMVMRDDESLTSCPAFTMPNYMVPTVSAKAKVRNYNISRDGSPAIGADHEAKKRFSFGLTQSIGNLRWNKGSLFTSKDSGSQRMTGKHKYVHSIGNLSIDSTISLPVGVGRKPFK